jgi:hypothetical protein
MKMAVVFFISLGLWGCEKSADSSFESYGLEYLSVEVSAFDSARAGYVENFSFEEDAVHYVMHADFGDGTARVMQYYLRLSYDPSDLEAVVDEFSAAPERDTVQNPEPFYPLAWTLISLAYADGSKKELFLQGYMDADFPDPVGAENTLSLIRKLRDSCRKF